MNGLNLMACAAFLAALAESALAENWPCWRGPRGDGTSHERGIPWHWGEDSNIVWKAEMPGLGHASPIVWEDRIFTVTALTDTEERVLLCFDRRSGKLLWQRTVLKAPLERKHRLNSYASSTPATDGNLVYAAFLDRDRMLVAAYDFEGNERWRAHPGVFKSMHGFCSSPVLFKDKVIVNGDHDGDSYIAALRRTDGATLWKSPRPNKTRSYVVPIIRELSGRTQMILSGDKSVASYDPNDGSLHWYMDGPTEQFVASLVYNPKADLLFLTGGYPELHILGIRHDGTGNVTQSHIVWRANKGVSYVPSPIAVEDYFLVVSDSGIASCFDAKTGTAHWQERLRGGHHASLVSGEGRVCFLSDQGVTTVVDPGPEFRVMATNKLEDEFFASPAISQGHIYLRGERYLYCVGGKAEAGNSR